MELPENRFKRALSEGRRQIGLWSSVMDSAAIEMLAGAGFDWIAVDCEHAPRDPIHVLQALQAMKGSDCAAMVRPPWQDAHLIKRVLDVGAQNVLVPYVETTEQARAAVAAVTYPPDGVRGVAGSMRASAYGAIADYTRRARSEIGLYLQIETRAGMEQVEEIAAVEGVDGLFVGPADLAASLGHPGALDHPEVVSAIRETLQRIQNAGLPSGFLSSDPAMIEMAAEAGCLFLAVDSDMGMLRRAALAKLDAVSRISV